MENYMKMALNEAKKAYNKNEVPIGAVIVKNNKIIAKAHNIKEKKQNVTRHAEIIAIEKASKKLSNWRLEGCEIYITLEPCPMCASAIQQSRIDTVYYGVSSSNKKNTAIVNEIFGTVDRNKAIKKIVDCDDRECKLIIQKYFSEKRL